MAEHFSRLLEKLTLPTHLDKDYVLRAFKDERTSIAVGAAGAVLVLLW